MCCKHPPIAADLCGFGEASAADQMENRFEPFVLPRWRDDHEFASLPLRAASGLAVDADMRALVLRRTDGIIGEINALLVSAARAALAAGRECIDRLAMDKADYRGPDERRAIFDAELRRGA